jgi:hypothetical protein
MNRRSHQYYNQDRPQTQRKDQNSEQETPKNEIQLIHDWERTARTYPDSPLEKRAQQITENRSQRDHKTAQQKPAINW